MKLHLSRWVCLDVDTNLRRAREESERAVAGGAGIVVFPELFLTGYARALEPARARQAFGAISAGAPGTLFVFGSISEEGRNRLTAWHAGREAARYDKVHLFRPNQEHQLWQAGERYVALRWRGLTIGLVNCNDVRFPEQARALRLRARCGLLLAPAWWPWRRDHVWRTLLRARALENGVYVAGCCVAASAHAGEEFAGAGNHVFDPLGAPVETKDDHTYELALEAPPALIVDPLEQAVAIDRVDVIEVDAPSEA